MNHDMYFLKSLEEIQLIENTYKLVIATLYSRTGKMQQGVAG